MVNQSALKFVLRVLTRPQPLIWSLFRFPFLRLLIFTSYVSLNKLDLVKPEAADKVSRVNNFIFQKREENHRVVAFFVVDKNAK